MRGAFVAQPPAVLPPPLPAHPSGWHSALFPSLALYSHAVSQVPTEADCVPAPLTTLLPRRCLRRAANSAREPDTKYIYFLLLQQGTQDGLQSPGSLPTRATGSPQMRSRSPGSQSAWASVPRTGGVAGWVCGTGLAVLGARGCEQVLTTALSLWGHA